MRTTYRDPLDDLRRVHLSVEFGADRDDVVDYALVLTFQGGETTETVRVYDGVHGRNEMHRYTRKLGKQPAEIFHRGTLGEGMRTALEHIKRGYEEMIGGWRA